jgi:hypothetical protein
MVAVLPNSSPWLVLLAKIAMSLDGLFPVFLLG